MGEAGMAGSFLQTTAASSLRRFAMEKADLPDETQQELLSFLSGKDSEEYAPQSGQIVGILKEMDDEMTKSLGEATATEEAAIKTHEALIAAKTKEVEALTHKLRRSKPASVIWAWKSLVWRMIWKTRSSRWLKIKSSWQSWQEPVKRKKRSGLRSRRFARKSL